MESLPGSIIILSLSKWKGNDGQIYLTLISDNQFSPLLETEVREFILKNKNTKKGKRMGIENLENIINRAWIIKILFPQIQLEN